MDGINWSPPILINTPSETTLEQPYLKVTVDTSKRTVHITINSIDRVSLTSVFATDLFNTYIEHRPGKGIQRQRYSNQIAAVANLRCRSK